MSPANIDNTVFRMTDFIFYLLARIEQIFFLNNEAQTGHTNAAVLVIGHPNHSVRVRVTAHLLQ